MIERIKSEIVSVGLATQFLTRIPVPVGDAYTEERFANSVKHYPLIGILIGCIAAGTYWLASQLFPVAIAVVLSTALTILATGAFHEDGLADTFDGIGGGTTRERALEIMKDSRIGTYGTSALLLALATKVSTVSHLGELTIIALIAAHSASRLSAVLVIAMSDYVRFEGKAKPVARSVNVAGIIWATATAAAVCYCFVAQGQIKPLLGGIAGLGAGHLLSRALFERKLGGYTGDCLGAVQQLSEIGFYLGVLACL